MLKKIDKNELVATLSRWHVGKMPLGIIHTSAGDLCRLRFAGFFSWEQSHLVFRSNVEMEAAPLVFTPAEVIGVVRIVLGADATCGEDIPEQHRALVVAMVEGADFVCFALKDRSQVAVTELSGESTAGRDLVTAHSVNAVFGKLDQRSGTLLLSARC